MKPLLNLSLGLALLATAGAVVVQAAGTNAPAASTNAPAKARDYRALIEKVRVKQQARNGLDEVQRGISAFQLRTGRLPAELSELVERGLLPDMPPAPVGMRYAYDRTTGNARLAPIANAAVRTNLPGSANLVTPR